MKNIRVYKAIKYCEPDFCEIEPYIFKRDNNVVISLCFQQEPELGEGNSPRDISQYPLEDILDQFNVYISDFYEDLNNQSSDDCYLEFCSNSLESIRNIRALIGKHVFNETHESADGTFIELMIEPASEN